ncbi:MAG: HEAT repeat domain-containing protein [Candidatus Riflebacteria bacterium]|nr:HEAT repeat domain-containing protein [Candidatus Riflebacteria bacterium]
MVEIELKILLLTTIYFITWFLVEKVFLRIYRSFKKEKESMEPAIPKKIVPLATPRSMGDITPLDQTARYQKGLKSPDWRIRRISAVQLGEKRGSGVVQSLIAALKDSREEVSIAAGESLAKIGDPSAIAALTEHVRNLEKRMDEEFEKARAA